MPGNVLSGLIGGQVDPASVARNVYGNLAIQPVSTCNPTNVTFDPQQTPQDARNRGDHRQKIDAFGAGRGVQVDTLGSVTGSNYRKHGNLGAALAQPQYCGAGLRCWWLHVGLPPHLEQQISAGW